MNELLTLAIFFIAFGVADGVGIAWEWLSRKIKPSTYTTTADREAMADWECAVYGMPFETPSFLHIAIRTENA